MIRPRVFEIAEWGFKTGLKMMGKIRNNIKKRMGSKIREKIKYFLLSESKAASSIETTMPARKISS